MINTSFDLVGLYKTGFSMECALICMVNSWSKHRRIIWDLEVSNNKFLYRIVYSHVEIYNAHLLRWFSLSGVNICITSDKSYWTHGYLMIADNVIDSVPLFLLGLANDIFVCGKSINLLRLCNPQVTSLFWTLLSKVVQVYDMKSLKNIFITVLSVSFVFM